MPFINGHFLGNLIIEVPEESGTLWGRCNYEPEDNLIVEEAETIQQIVDSISGLITSFHGVPSDKISFFITFEYPQDAKEVISAMAEDWEVFGKDVALMVLRYGYDIVSTDTNLEDFFVRMKGEVNKDTLLVEGGTSVLYSILEGRSKVGIPLAEAELSSDFLITEKSEAKFQIRYPQPKIT